MSRQDAWPTCQFRGVAAPQPQMTSRRTLVGTTARCQGSVRSAMIIGIADGAIQPEAG